jgi:hypothetical protein
MLNLKKKKELYKKKKLVEKYDVDVKLYRKLHINLLDNFLIQDGGSKLYKKSTRVNPRFAKLSHSHYLL